MSAMLLLRDAPRFRWLVIGAGLATALVVLFPPRWGSGSAGQASGSYQPAPVGAPPGPSTGLPRSPQTVALPTVVPPSAPLAGVAPALPAMPPRLPSYHATGGELAVGPALDDVVIPQPAHGAVLHAPSQPAPRWGEPLPPLESTKP